MAYQRWWKTIRDQQGNAINGASVSVYYGGTGTLALVYDPNSDDSSPSVLPNPFTTTANGVFGFAAADGEYDVQVRGGALATQQYRVTLNGFVSGTAGSVVADLAAPSGAGMIGCVAPYSGAVARTQAGKNSDFISVMDFGATGDGTTDDTTAIQLAITAGGAVYFPAGTYIISAALVIASNGTHLFGAGNGVSIIKAKDGVAFEYMLTANALSDIGIHDLTWDMNQANRATALQAAVMRSCGPVFTSCTDTITENCAFKNSLGSGSVPGVGFGLGGTGLRNKVIGCTALDCGIPSYASDGFYTSGTQTLIVGCTAKNCLDTGFVLEKSDYSGIVGCTSDGCSAGGAITALSSDSTGNFINGLTVNGLSSSVTGGVQIGALGAGNLLDTSIDGLVMTDGGTGPALNFRKTSTGRIIGATVRAKINGASTQGILVDGCDELVVASGTSVKGTVGPCVQVQTGCTKIVVDGAQLSPTGPNTFGFYSTDGTDITVANCQINATAGQMTYGVYFAGTGTRCSSLLNKIQGYSVAPTGADGTTTPIVVAPMITASGFYFGKAATTNLYDLSGVLKTDQAFVSGLTVKALGNLMEVGPTGASSGNGGSFRTRNDAGTASWIMGHLGSGGATAWVLYDQVAADSPVTVVSGVGGAITIARNTKFTGTTGFNNTNPIAKPTVTGAKGSNAALASLLTALANYGLITDSTTA